MIKQQLFIGAALIAGAAVGYFLRGESAAQKPGSPPLPRPRVEHSGKIADAGDAASNAALRRRIEELERQLAEVRMEPMASTNIPVAETAREEGRRRDPRAFFEEMKKNDPARYAQMTNRMAHFRRRQQQRALSRLEFLESIDTSGMSASAKRTHQRCQELMAQREELRDGMRNFEELSEDERRENFQKMRNLDRELQIVSAAERRNLFGETAKGLGLSGEDANALSATIEQVIDATNPTGHAMGGPPPNGAPQPLPR